MNLLRTRKLEIDIGGRSWLLISCLDYKLARKLQKLTKTYKDHIFKSGDEAMFRIPSSLVAAALATLGLPMGEQRRIESSFKSWLLIDSGVSGNPKANP